MLSRFDALLVIMIVLVFTGWPTGFINDRLPKPIVTVAVVVLLLVLLLLGVVRY